MSPLDLEFVIGAAFVCVNAYDRFNTPCSNRATTTALRYYLGAAAYVFIAFFTFFFLSHYPDLLKLIAGESLDATARQLPPALMTALVLTVLLEKIPFFSGLDKWLRRIVQDLASIPQEARRLSHRLQRCEFEIPEQTRQRLTEKALAGGVEPKAVAFAGGKLAQHLWIKNSALMEELEAWEAEPRFSSFMLTFEADLAQLKQQYRQLGQKAAWVFKLAEETGEHELDAKSMQLMDEHVREFNEDAEQLFEAICDLLSRGVLQCRLSESARVEQLAALGFCGLSEWSERRLSFDQLTSIFILVCTILMFGMLVASQTGQSIQDQLVRVIMVAVIYCVAIGCALYPKDRWQIAQRSEGGPRPAASYLLSGAMAALIGLAVSVAFKWVIYHFDIQQTLGDLAVSYPWGFLTFATAAFTAYQVDNRRTSLGRLQPLAEALFQCAATTACGYVTYLWLANTGFKPAQSPAFLVTLLPMIAAIGFLIGLLVPRWYRNAQHGSAPAGEARCGQPSAPASPRLPLRKTGRALRAALHKTLRPRQIRARAGL